MIDKNYDFPDWVKLGLISATLKYMCGEQKFNFDKLPDEIKKFVENNPEEPAQSWAERLMESSFDMPIEELEKWVINMPGGFFRAEMRSMLKQRKSEA
jgi:hypothetical protein